MLRRCAYFLARWENNSTRPNGLIHLSVRSIWLKYRGYHEGFRRYQDELVPLRKQLKDAAKSKKKNAFSTQNKIADIEGSEWELTVGIEIHAQLNTTSKLFSRRPTLTSSE